MLAWRSVDDSGLYKSDRQGRWSTATMRARPEVSAKIHSGLQRRDLFGAAVEELRLAAHREQRAIDHSLAPLVPAWDGPPSTLASPRADFRRLCTCKGAPAADALPLFKPASATRRDMGR